MALLLGPEERQARLLELAAEWGVGTLSPPSIPLIRPMSSPLSPSFRTSNDEFLAEELLKRRRLNATPDKADKSIRRAFTTNKKKGWEPNEIFDALDAHVSNMGSPAVAEALIGKLMSAGGDLNVANMKSKTNLLTRRRSLESLERSRVLQKAIENRQADMIAVLVQHADHLTLDAALPMAIRSSDPSIAQMLLQQGANASQTADGQDAFRQLCIMGGQADLVGLILMTEGRPAPEVVSQAMVDAARKGCLDTVLRLSRSTADGGFQYSQGLKEAVAQCRVDIALAILTGSNPPTPGTQGLTECFKKLIVHTAIGPNEKLVFAEALLCAGATGEVVSSALLQACDTEFYEMVELLVRYGASVEYQGAAALRSAASKGQSSLIQLLLPEQTMLSSTRASEAVAHMPKTVAADDRHTILNILLRKGANGAPLHDALIDAVESSDLNSVQLLLASHFPGGRLASSHDLKKGPRALVYDRHATASVDHNGGLAIQIAVMMGNTAIVKLLLASKPSTETLAQVFPNVHTLSPVDRYHMAECFLASGLPASVVSEALQEAISEEPPRRDENLISLLLKYNADVNFNEGASIMSAISHRDISLLQTLLKSRPTPQTVVSALAAVMAIDDKRTRYQMVSLLLEAGANRDSTAVSSALTQVLPIKPTDIPLITLLLEAGKADANYNQGLPVLQGKSQLSVTLHSVSITNWKPNAETLARGLGVLSDMPTTAIKATKVDSILRLTKQKDSIDALLVKEVQAVLKTPADKRVMAVLTSVLAAGADVNAHKAAALCHAVAAADMPISDLLFAAKPRPASLEQALPHALHIQDPMDRLSFAQKLLEGGVSPREANRALLYAIQTFPTDVPLIITLAAQADSSDGEALTQTIKQQNSDVVELLIAKTPKKYPTDVVNRAFREATAATDKIRRLAMSSALLKAGAAGLDVSDALLAAAADSDLTLGTLLLENGASVEHREGQAVVEASRAGAVEVLTMLFGVKAEVKNLTLAKGFQAATQIGDLKRRGSVLRLLLEKGVHGEVVDAQLVSAARFGDDADHLVRLLLEFGADVNYNSGEAIWTATRSAIMGSLKLMLGITKVADTQKKPNEATLLRALKATRKLSNEPRYQVIEWLFEAGLPATDEIHIALNKAVKDEPDLRLIKLLLKHGASPLANSCETLIDATQRLLADVVAVFVEGDVPRKDISWAFKQAFAPETSQDWLSEQGIQVAKLLLEKGAEGESLTLALSSAMDAVGSERDAISRQFVELLIQFDADVNHENGIVVQKAAKRADSELISQVLKKNPSSHAVSMAFPYIFDSELSEDEARILISLFTEYHNGEQRLDTLFAHPTSEPVVFRAVSQFPRSTKILQTLLDAGYYHDQMTVARVMDDIEEDEQVSLLFWALLQPQKKVSSSLIELLIQRGAKVNFETRLSKTTPLMLAIQSRRPDLVKTLILADAEVDGTDATGNTPLTMATQIGGDLGTSMMSNILAADPSKNDGSLHNAARELNLRALQVLVEFGHDVDFPSPLHGGRSALGEVCLNAAAHAGTLSAAQEKQMEKVMTYLLEKDADISLHSEGKSVLLLALDSAHPVATTKALLKVGLWKHVNKSFNNFNDGHFTYSPTQYVTRILPESDTQGQLLTLLKSNRATDVYYANDGPQPEGAVNLPDELLRAERERRVRAEQLASEDEAHARLMARHKEIAAIQDKIYANRAELEDARAARKRADELDGMKEKAAVEDKVFAAELRRKRAEREASIQHEQRLTEAGLTRARLVAEAEIDLEARKQERMLEWEQSISSERVSNARELSAVRVREREDLDRIDAANHSRIANRISEHKKLVDSQNNLAQKLGSAGVPPRRQIGYVTGELD
ncbi:ankyrin [Thozetella sp. PMI_491]|nr:ankyrin [Thozetella sp. PMI_491]